uniref:Uncharacterized protein n=1 Tax=Cacopsylla melanoneura TaxID=428564 RepID=A0A8D8WXD7_9HEMI
MLHYILLTLDTSWHSLNEPITPIKSPPTLLLHPTLTLHPHTPTISFQILLLISLFHTHSPTHHHHHHPHLLSPPLHPPFLTISLHLLIQGPPLLRTQDLFLNIRGNKINHLYLNLLPYSL